MIDNYFYLKIPQYARIAHLEQNAGYSSQLGRRFFSPAAVMLVFCLLCGLFILRYALYQREFLPGCPSMVHMQNREQ